MTHPSCQFTRSIAANVVYWRQRTQTLTDDTLPALDRDRQNLFRAARFGLRLSDTWRETAELILQAYVLVERRGYWGEWIPMLERLLAKCPADDLALRGRILDQLGLFYRFNRQLEKAFSTHQEELQLGLKLEDKWRQAHANINLGAVCRQMRRFEEAETYILNAQKDFSAIDAPVIKHAFVTRELGLLAEAQGEWANAEAYFGESVSMWRQVNDPVNLVSGLKLLGRVLAAQDKIDEASTAYHEAIKRLNLSENHLDKTRVLNDLGTLHLSQGNIPKAQLFLLAADSPFLRQSGNLFEQAVVANNIGNLYLVQGQIPEARHHFQRSISLWEACDDEVQLANAVGGLAEAKAAEGKIEEARQLFQRALDLLAQYPQDTWGQKVRERFQREVSELNMLS